MNKFSPEIESSLRTLAKAFDGPSGKAMFLAALNRIEHGKWEGVCEQAVGLMASIGAGVVCDRMRELERQQAASN